jgi:hypothetical protein
MGLNSSLSEGERLSFALKGYDRERVGVRGVPYRYAVTPHPTLRVDLSLWER